MNREKLFCMLQKIFYHRLVGLILEMEFIMMTFLLRAFIVMTMFSLSCFISIIEQHHLSSMFICLYVHCVLYVIGYHFIPQISLMPLLS